MLDATERKTLAWCAFVAGVLCLIPGETPQGPRWWNFVVQVLARMLEHRATQIAWALCAAIVAYHLIRTRKEEAAVQAPPAGDAESGRAA
jgi:Na+/melibiose symporter-like transporter